MDTFKLRDVQRLHVKKIAEGMGVPVTGQVRVGKDSWRRYPRAIGDIRVSILERCLGPGLGKVNKGSVNQLDAAIRLMATTYKGGHGSALRLAQRFLCEGQTLFHEARTLYDASNGKSRKVQLGALAEAVSLLAQARVSFGAANELHELISAEGIEAANAFAATLERERYEARQRSIKVMVAGGELNHKEAA